jgi:aryl-alcohol dehydrogenase-like predicted oxidoreductase
LSWWISIVFASMCGSSAPKSYGSGGSSNGISCSFRCPGDHRIPALSSRFEIPSVVLGCGNFGGIGSAPAFFGQGETREEAFALMDAAWELGLDWFDTADAYGGGRSETWIGDWIAATGNRPRITTKTFNPMDEGADSGLAPERVRRQLRSSLERLRVDRIDLYLAHEPDPDTPIAETIAALDSAPVGFWGLSNYGTVALKEALVAGRPALVQNSFSLLDRGDEREVIPLCAEHGVAFQCFGPLAGGWLTGKYRRGAPLPEGSRMTMRPEPYRHLDSGAVYDGLEGLESAAAERGVSMAGLALGWLLAHPGVSSIVVGPRKPEQLEPVREAMGLELTRDEVEEVGSLFP